MNEKEAMLRLEKVGAKLTKLRPEQASYIRMEVKGRFKPKLYRY